MRLVAAIFAVGINANEHELSSHTIRAYPYASSTVSTRPEYVVRGRKDRLIIEPEFEEGTAVARAYEVSEPTYTCPKAGYTLVGEECVSETRVDSRQECPIGYKFTEGYCQQTYTPSFTCSKGRISGRMCQILEVFDPDFQCPVNTQLGADGSCTITEAVSIVDVCPEGSVRSEAGCLAVDYSEPAYVCPPGSVNDGRKCRKEVVSYKYKKVPNRRLNELEGETAYYVDDLYDNGVQYAEVDIATSLGNDPLEFTNNWVPAQPVGKVKPRKYKDVPVDDFQWETVQVPVVVPQKEKVVRVKQPKLKEVVVKEKKPLVPQQVVKVISQAAEKVCPVGSRFGSTCVLETVIPPVKECPVPLIDGQCARRIPVSPVATCLVGNLTCHGRICRCELLSEQPAIPTCMADLGHVLTGDQCIAKTAPRRLCPLGFFLDRDNVSCVRKDIEPALCLFSVTYSCSDCVDSSPLSPLGAKRSKARVFMGETAQREEISTDGVDSIPAEEPHSRNQEP